jgi:hypothetical protein
MEVRSCRAIVFSQFGHGAAMIGERLSTVGVWRYPKQMTWPSAESVPVAAADRRPDNSLCLRTRADSKRIGFPFAKPGHAASFKRSICRIQFVSGFQLVKMWATAFGRQVE